MLFHSLDFIIFLSVVFFLCLSTKNLRLQNLLLLVSSYFFYGFLSFKSFDGVGFGSALSSSTKFIALLLFSSSIDYFCGLYLAKIKIQRKKTWILIVSIVIHLTILLVSKYYNFFIENASQVIQWFGLQPNAMTLKVLMPIGISFYSFQSMSYTIDVYRGRIKVCRNFVDYSLFVAFFPQLIAGPIEKATSLLPQVLNKRKFELGLFYQGLTLFMLGFFKKVWVADQLADYLGYFSSGDLNGGMVLALAVCFSFCLYFDFCGYSNMARGVANILGFELTQNFRSPFFATNIREFFERWHVSLISWVRTYVSSPLESRGVGNSFVTILSFVLIGIWHGASWNFVIWGFSCGLLMVLSDKVSQYLSHGFKDPTLFSNTIFGIFGWFFTFTSMSVLFLCFYLDGDRQLIEWSVVVISNLTFDFQSSLLFWQILIISSPFLLLDYLCRHKSESKFVLSLPVPLRVGLLFCGYIFVVNDLHLARDFLTFLY